MYITAYYKKAIIRSPFLMCLSFQNLPLPALIEGKNNVLYYAGNSVKDF